MGPTSMGVTISLPMAQERTAHSPIYCETEFLFKLVLILSPAQAMTFVLPA